MKQLHVPKIKGFEKNLELAELSVALDRLPEHAIEEVPWPAFAYKPKVNFCIAHTGNCILLKYEVEEHRVRCVHQQTNDPVYEDSCVEAFFAFDNVGYYNLEFNSIGTARVGYGKYRTDRTLLDADAIQLIGRHTNVSDKKDGQAWSLLLQIPVEMFVHHSIKKLDRLQCRANFYKCGDLTPEPHFLAWNKIAAPEPDFHLPAFFGQLNFA